ncbi:MAG: glucosamine-6-phosphate deaminase [Oscillospiraceae bacterium]|jgi:glucosamine-6-phosphate deaminase|nr:glucosamine-6-phosphate deaminase [Oscillospiraceae bacterium]
MKVYVLEDEQAIGLAVGDLFCDAVRQKPNAVLGLATGASPVPSYRRMIAQYRAGNVSFKEVESFNLDEYCDLPPEHANSYHSFMAQELFSQIDIRPANCHFLDGNAADAFAESERYRLAIEAAGGIDLQLLGIGRNGHIGFNEPAENFTIESFKVALTPSTIAANSVYFSDVAMPKHAMTMGVGAILRAKRIVLVATGSAKADAVKAMLEGEISPRCPATALREHADTLVYLDPAAAGLLRK